MQVLGQLKGQIGAFLGTMVINLTVLGMGLGSCTAQAHAGQRLEYRFHPVGSEYRLV